MRRLLFLLPVLLADTASAKSKKFQQLSDEITVQEITLNLDENEDARDAYNRQKELNLSHDYVILESGEMVDFEVIDINPKIVSMPTSGASLVPKHKKQATRFTYKVAHNSAKEIYTKECRLCHGDSRKLYKRYKVSIWNKAFLNNGQRLIEVHDRSNILKLTHGYFKSSAFSMQLNFLKDYILNSQKE